MKLFDVHVHSEANPADPQDLICKLEKAGITAVVFSQMNL